MEELKEKWLEYNKGKMEMTNTQNKFSDLIFYNKELTDAMSQPGDLKKIFKNIQTFLKQLK